MITFIRYLVLLTYVSVSHCFAIIIVDIERYNDSIYVNGSSPVSNSLKVVTFDTDAQKITRVDFLVFNHRSSDYNNFSLGFFGVGFTPKDMTDFTITIGRDFKGIIRRDGAFSCHLSTGSLQAKSLSHLDETRPTLMGVTLLDNVTFDTFAAFSEMINSHDILEQCKQRKINETNNDIQKLDAKDAPHIQKINTMGKGTKGYEKSQEQVNENAKQRKCLVPISYGLDL